MTKPWIDIVQRLTRLVQSSPGGTRARPSPVETTVRSPKTAIDTRWAPRHDGRPDPGEIVWTWVPYEDDPSQGKDCPVLIIGRIDEQRLAALQLTSKDHDWDARQEARAGRFWLDIGTGPWDSRGRPSEVRLNRLLTIKESAVRREGAALDEARYNDVLAAARQYLP